MTADGQVFEKRHPPPGARPGSLMIPPNSPFPHIRVMNFDRDTLEEIDISDPAELSRFVGGGTVTWIDVQGLGDEATLRKMAETFGLHILVLEDIVNVPQRPKLETYDGHAFLVTRMAKATEGHDIQAEQVSFILGDGFVLTVQEHYGDVFDPVRTRIRRGGGPIRTFGADYLAYALMDAVIDGYYPVLEGLGEYLQEMEETVVDAADASTLRRIHDIKRVLLTLRRAVWPQREVLNAILQGEVPQFSEPVRVYVRDCYDHTVQLIDVIETCRELASGLMDVYLSSMSNRMNEVMKVLTIMASIFIPLTFIAGIYGMNFQHMPELQSRWAYPFILAVMVTVAVGMLWYFRRRGWIGGRR
jgi:magnesium transporter